MLELEHLLKIGRKYPMVVHQHLSWNLKGAKMWNLLLRRITDNEESTNQRSVAISKMIQNNNNIY
jgi:hypothetical protein